LAAGNKQIKNRWFISVQAFE